MLRSRARHPLLSTLVLALVVSLFAGCGDEADPPNLEGTYELVSISLPGEGTLTSPEVTGMLVLTANTYTMDVAFTEPDRIPLQDSGTYALDGTGWTQTSDQGMGSATGEWVYANGNLTIDATSTDGRTVSVWRFIA